MLHQANFLSQKVIHGLAASAQGAAETLSNATLIPQPWAAGRERGCPLFPDPRAVRALTDDGTW